MDMYGSLSNPPDCLRIDDDFLEFSDHSHSHLPPPLHHPFSDHPNFPSLPSEEAAELEWLAQFIDDTTSFPDFPLNHTIPIGSGSHTTSFLPNNRYNNANTDHNSNHKPSDVMEGNGGGEGEGEGEGGVRRCSHCASEKTPQWRTGPLGPKTLCNACGVRFKSGRLVPEYRPAASPTFVLTQHSNSHRKVMELRRQKELLRQHQQQQEHKHDFKVC